MADFETNQHRVKSIDFSAYRLGGGTTVLNINTKTEDERRAEHTFFMWNDHEPVITLDKDATADKGLAAKLLNIVDPQPTYEEVWAAGNEEGYAMGKLDGQPSAAATALAIKQATNVLRGAITDALDDLTWSQVHEVRLGRVQLVIGCSRWASGTNVSGEMEYDGVNTWLLDNLDLPSLYDAIVSGSCRIHQARNPAEAWETLAAILAAIINE